MTCTARDTAFRPTLRPARAFTSLVALVILLAGMLPNSAVASETFDHPLVVGFERFYAAGERVDQEGGRLLLTELSCTACHVAETAELAPKGGPVLPGIRDRMDRDWVRQFLSQPQQTKPGTTMPHLLDQLPAKQRAEHVDALLAFLWSLEPRMDQFQLELPKTVIVAPEFWAKGEAARGELLYHQIGCVACHAPDPSYEGESEYLSDRERLLQQLGLDPEELEGDETASAVPSLPHGRLADKYTARALTFFLIDPPRFRPAGRMPSLELGPEEAADIAAYLLREHPQTSSSPTTGAEAAVASRADAANGRAERERHAPDLVQRGRELFHSLGCAHCHAVEEQSRPSATLPTLAQLATAPSQGCLAEQTPRDAPRFHLSAAQRAALRSTVADGLSSLADDAALAAHRTMLRLNCYGCHERDGRGGVDPPRWQFFETVDHVDLGDEGRIPPSLSGVGAKLLPGWLAAVLRGEGDVRPHMLARMPQFAAEQVAMLPQQFVEADELPESGKQRKLSGGKVAAGRRLFDTGCVQCHELAGERLPGVRGIDLADLDRRLRPDWFRRFLLDPNAVKPRTRMPTFFPEGKAANRDILEGDSEAQIQALWAYLASERPVLPDRLLHERAHNFELVPDESPLLLRTFMEEAGTHAVAVGFPASIHLAFDAEQVRPAIAWRGRFLDAHGTWFDRFTPPAAPLGKAIVQFPPGAALALLDDSQQIWPRTSPQLRWRGFRLDDQDVPTFLYDVGPYRVEDRLAPDHDKRGFVRTLHISPGRKRSAAAAATPNLWLRLHAGTSLERQAEHRFASETGLQVSCSPELSQRARLRQRDDQADWVVPLEIPAAGQTIEVHYQW